MRQTEELTRQVEQLAAFASRPSCHPSDNLAPVLAATEHSDGRGRDLLTALAVAYQGQYSLDSRVALTRGNVAIGLAILFVSVIFPASRLRAQSSGPLPQGRPPEWGVEVGYGFTVHLNIGHSDEHVFLFEPSMGLRVSSRLEYVAEGHFEQDFTPRGYVIGVMSLGARLYLGSGRTLPYVSIGGGLGWTNLTQLDEIDRRFNFLLQASAGIRRSEWASQALTVEARLIHISNGGTEQPNLGLNCLVLLAGWRFR